jgi:hypothetical protein
MFTKSIGCALFLAAVIAFPCHGALLISEIVYNEVSSDTTGEWIEIFNNGTTAIDLSNYKIGDEETSGATSTTEAMHRFPAGASIAPREVQIVAVSATRFLTVYGFLPTYEANSTDASVPDLLPYPSWDPDGLAFNMANSNDQALILGPADELVDAVSWGNTFAFNPALDPNAELDGQSYERIKVFRDTNTAADWQLGPASSTAAERSTPGVVPIPEPASFVAAVWFVLALGFRRSRRIN